MGTNARKRRSLIRQVVFLIVLGLVLFFGVQAWVQAYENRYVYTLHFENQGKATPDYHVRVARNEAEREYGLMFVKPDELQGGKGMIFLFPDEAIRQFWMKNTVSPLDMIFIDGSRNVVGVVEEAHPFSTELLGPNVPSTFVLELLAGTAHKDGIVKGSKIVLPPDLPPAQ